MRPRRIGGLAMIKRFALLALASATPAAAADVGPAVGYIKAASAPEVYLITPEGTGRLLVYRGPSRKRAFGLDIRPGGGELAFEETDCCKVGPGTLKIVRYDVYGRIEGEVKKLPLSCRIGSLDYHPDPSTNSLLLTSSCTGPVIVDTTTLGMSSAGLPPAAAKAAWLTASTLLYAEADKLWTFTVGGEAATEVTAATFVQSLDTSPDGNQALVTNGLDKVVERVTSISNKTPLSAVTRGTSGRFSADGNGYIFVSPGTRGQYVMIGTFGGNERALTGKGEYTAVDWRD